jgi:rod shape-determining protein MreC
MLEFLRRHQVPVSSGVLLLLAAMLISANARGGQRVDPLTRVLLEAIYPFQMAVTAVSSRVGDVWAGYVNLVGTRVEADALRERVRVLEGEVTRLTEVEESHRRLSELLEFRQSVGARVVAARVIGWDASARDHTVTLDKGEVHGVVKGAAVLVPEGVVGHVFRAGPHAAQVLLISDRNSGVDAIVQRSRVRGIVQGQPGGCELIYVKRGADVEVGDKVVTSGLDGIFPKGVLVGDVVRVKRREQGLFQTIVVEPRVAFRRLEEVLVTTDRPPGESVG